MFLLKWLLNAANALLQEIPPPRSKQTISPNLITPEQLTPTEREIITRAEESFRLLEAQSQDVLARIQQAPVTLVEVPEFLEISVSEPVVEVLEISEISEVPAIIVTAELLQAEEPAPAGWALIEAGTEEATEGPPAKLSRSQLVEGLLDEAWQQGITTYAAMMGYVESQTGKGCSKRVVSAWKKARHLAAAA